MRKQIGIKLDEDDLTRWDAWAESHGLTRTTLIETAVERFISDSLEQAPPQQPAESRTSSHQPRPGKRRAYQCRREGCNRRTFLMADEPDRIPECPEHGPMFKQANQPYFGQATE